MAYGCSIGWASASVPFLQSDQSPLKSGPLNLEEASWITALLCFGGLSGNIFYGLIANQFGRKIPMLTLSIPNIVIQNNFNWSFINIIPTAFPLLDQLAFNYFWTISDLFLCVKIFGWIFGWRNIYFRSVVYSGNC